MGSPGLMFRWPAWPRYWPALCALPSPKVQQWARVTATYLETQTGRGHARRVAPFLPLPAASTKNGVLLAFSGTSQRRLQVDARLSASPRLTTDRKKTAEPRRRRNSASLCRRLFTGGCHMPVLPGSGAPVCFTSSWPWLPSPPCRQPGCRRRCSPPAEVHRPGARGTGCSCGAGG